MSEKKSESGLRPARLTATALAGVTGAFLASQLGVYGTVVGAGLLSLSSTVGTEFYVRSLDRTKDAALRTKAGARSRTANLPRQRQGEQPTAGMARQSRQSTATSAQPTTAWPAQAPSPQAAGTARWSAPSAGVNGRTVHWPTPTSTPQEGSPAPQPGEPTTVWPTGEDDRTTAYHTPGGPGVGDQRTRYVSLASVWPDRDIDAHPRRRPRRDEQTTVGGDGDELESEYQDGDGEEGGKRRRMAWPVAIGVGLLGFVISLLAVTGFEALSGKAISGDDRTTVGGVFTSSSGTVGDEPTKQEQPEPTQQHTPGEPTDQGEHVVPDEGGTQPEQEPTVEREPQQPEQQPEEAPGGEEDQQQAPDDGSGQEPAPAPQPEAG